MLRRRSGASGFVLKDTPPEHLLDAIRIIAAGDALLTPSITRRLITEVARRPRAVPPGASRLLDSHQIAPDELRGGLRPRAFRAGRGYT